MENSQKKTMYIDIFKYSLGGLGVTLVTNLVMTYLNFFSQIFSELQHLPLQGSCWFPESLML